MKNNYKNKYINAKFENKKIQSDFSEKENVLKTNFTSELIKLKSEKESIEKTKVDEETQRKMKDKKLKV